MRDDGGPHVFDADTATELLRQVAAAHPDADAYVEADGARLSFADWDRAADGVATGLAEHGVRAGDVVCLMLPSCVDYVVAYLGAMRLGALTSGINLRLGPREVAHVLDQSDPQVVIVDDALTEPPAGRRCLHRRDLAEMATRPPSDLPPVDAASPVAIVWTSGSTGRPKGAVFDHRNLAAVAMASGPLSAPFDRRLSPLPFPHVGTMTRVWDEIANVVATVITPTPWRADAALGLIERERVTVAQGVPTQWELMLRHPDFGTTDVSSLRLVGTGGSRVPADLVARLRHRLGVPVLNRYSTTEAAIVTGTFPDDPDELVVETVGRSGGGVEVRVVDDDGRTLPADAAGTVQVRSGAVMRGYWRDPDLTRRVLDQDGWLTVGDLGQLDARGNLRFRGRQGEMYLRGGYNVYPSEVEDVLRQHPTVTQVAVVGVPDPVLGEIGHAFVAADAPVTLDELRATVKAELADYKRPDRLTIVDALPLNSTSKVDRAALVRQAERALATDR